MCVIGVRIGECVFWLLEEWVDRNEAAQARAEWHIRLRSFDGDRGEDVPPILRRVGGEPLLDAVERVLEGKNHRDEDCRDDKLAGVTPVRSPDRGAALDPALIALGEEAESERTKQPDDRDPEPCSGARHGFPGK